MKVFGLLQLGVCVLAGCGTGNQDSWMVTRTVGPVLLAPDCAKALDDVFQGENPWMVPMKLVIEHRGCQCLGYKVPDEIKPGETGAVVASVRLSPHTKDDDFYLVFKTGIQQHPRLTLRLKVKTIACIEIDPPELPVVKIPFAKPGRISFFALLHQKENPRAPVSIETEPAWINARVAKESFSQELGISNRKLLIDLEIPAQRDPPQSESGQITIRVDEKKLTREIRWSTQKPITVVPSDLFFGAGKSQRSLVLNASEPFSFSLENEEEIRKNGIEVIGRSTGKSSKHVVEVLCGGIEDSPSRSVNLIFSTDHPVQRLVRVPVYIFSRRGQVTK